MGNRKRINRKVKSIRREESRRMLMEMGELVGRSSSSRRPESELDGGGGVEKSSQRTWVDLNSAYATAAA